MIQVEGHKALVVGAGQSAKGKIRALTDFGADVTVVAPVISADVVKQGKNIRIERRVYRPGETKDYEIVVAATDNPAVNKQVAHDAARFGAICSVADEPERGGFIFPQIIKRSSYSVAVCTEDMDGMLAAKLKEKIEDAVPEKADEIAALFSKARKKLDERERGAQGGEESSMRLADLAEGRKSEEDTARSRIEEGLQYEAGAHDAAAQGRVSAEEGGSPDDTETEMSGEGSVIRVGSLSDRLSQARADSVIVRLEKSGLRCSKVLLECPEGAGAGRSDAAEGISTTIMNAEDALSGNEIDIAVRAASDIPYVLPDDLAAEFCLPREDSRDVLVTKKGTGNKEIEVIETDSPSRKAQIEKFLKTGEARVSAEGIQAIVNRLKAGETDAAILAAPDLEKLLITEDDEVECEYIDIEKSLPPACQGLIVLETRMGGKAYEAASELSDENAVISLLAERAFMREAGASQEDETAAYSAINGQMLFMKAMRKAGQRTISFAGMDKPENAESLGVKLAEKIRAASQGLRN